MRKHEGTPSRRDKHVTPAANSPPGVARGRFVGGQQSGLAGCKPPPLFTRRASSCSSQRRHQGEPWAPLHDRVHLPTYLPEMSEAAFFMMAEELSVVEDLALAWDGVSTWFDRQGFEVHLSWKDETELLGVVDLTGKGAGGYLEVILSLFARLPFSS